MKLISRKRLNIGQFNLSRQAFLTMLVALTLLAGGVAIGRVSAESYPGGDDNGRTSRIAELDATLAGLGYGSQTATPDWGSMWNRIKTSATWSPSGNVTADEVAAGKTFYGSDRTLQTGTRSLVGPCETQAWHDNNGSANQADNCTEQNVWTEPNDGVVGTDKRDPVTGLIWSHRLRNNAGAIEFSPTAPSAFSWDNSHTNNEGRTAIQLCSDMGDGWRLPTQKELMQAYIDGSFWNLSQPAAYHWSATEGSATDSWTVNLSLGSTFPTTETDAYGVRCVR